MTTRTDNHRKAVIKQEDYSYVGQFYQGTSAEMDEAINDGSDNEFLESHKPFEGNYEDHGGCDICGAVFSYGCYYLHVPSDTYISIGHQCASELMQYDSRIAYEKNCIKGKVKNVKRHFKRRALAGQFIEAHNLQEVLEVDHHITKNIHDRLLVVGSISNKQIELLHKLSEDAKSPKQEVEYKPVPSGKVTVSGEVLCTKMQEGHYGSTLKMLVLDDNMFKVWGTVPASLWDSNETLKGRKIQFNCTVEKSKDDECFGFFKRPTKATFTQ